MDGSARNNLRGFDRIDAGSNQLFDDGSNLAHHHHDFSVSS
ncbi:hypothetical protein [Sinorhizobium meliloti]|nr:hypothetical protein U8C30_13045 [Sinorhizobium meliloti]